jgi:ADP-ribose pyrophosphatase
MLLAVSGHPIRNNAWVAAPEEIAHVDDRHWKVLAERELFEAPPFLRISAQSIELPDGRRIESYYQVEMPDTATIYAETPDSRVILHRSYRHGARRVCLGFPGGHITLGEAPLAAARRELLEETGHEAAHWEALGSYITNANHRCQISHFFRATGCQYVTAPDSGDLEDAETILLSRSEILAAARRGDFPFVGQIAMLSLALQPDLFK